MSPKNRAISKWQACPPSTIFKGTFVSFFWGKSSYTWWRKSALHRVQQSQDLSGLGSNLVTPGTDGALRGTWQKGEQQLCLKSNRTCKGFLLLEVYSYYYFLFPLMLLCHMGVSKNRGKTPKMDGLFHGTPYSNGWFGFFSHYFWKHLYFRKGPSKIWMGANPNGPRSVSCDRAIRYSVFFENTHACSLIRRKFWMWDAIEIFKHSRGRGGGLLDTLARRTRKVALRSWGWEFLCPFWGFVPQGFVF